LIPPLIGFFSKQFVLYSAVQSGYFFISIVAIIVSVISASYYLKIIRILYDTNVNSFIKIFWGKEKINQYFTKNSTCSIFSLRKGLLERYANINLKRINNNQNSFHANYFKEIQLIFILIFIFKFEFISKIHLNNKSNNSITLNNFTKDIFLKKELWQLNTSSYHSLYLNNLDKKGESKIISKSKKFEIVNIKNSNFFYQLSNYHSFLISNLTIIILLFVLKPSILLSSIRLLSLSIFTY
jgi:hypothetical protein